MMLDDEGDASLAVELCIIASTRLLDPSPIIDASGSFIVDGLVG